MAPSYPATAQPSLMASGTSAVMPGIPTMRPGSSSDVLGIGRTDGSAVGFQTMQIPHVPLPTSMPATHPATPKTMSPRGSEKAGGGGHSPGESSSKTKVKEADEIKVSPLPAVALFRAWLDDLRDAVVAASGRSDSAFSWMPEVEQTDMTFDG